MMIENPSTAALSDVEIVAHRGASFDAPENTLAAFKLAFLQHADAIEGDFHLTIDGEIVCMHNPTTRDIAGDDLRIADSTLKQLRALDVGRWKYPKFAGERMPTLEEVLAVVPAGKKALLEIKCGPEIVPALKAIINASGPSTAQLRLISFNASVIAAVKAAMPEVKAYWLTGYERDDETGLWSPTAEFVLATLEQCHADGLDSNANLQVLTPSFVAMLRKARMEFHTWTVDKPEIANKLIELGVDSITTNRPGWLREQLAARTDPCR